MAQPKQNSPNSQLSPFFEVRTRSVAGDRPLPCDIYLVFNGKPLLFRRRGDQVTEDRLLRLSKHGLQQLLIPSDQRHLYLDSLKSIVKDPDAGTDTKSKFIKESAYVHIHDLFHKQDIQPVVTEAKALIEDMVSFVSSDISAVSSLMRLSAHDYYTYNHSVDVAVYAIVLARKIFGEDKKFLLAAGLSGLLHDIGKRRIDLALINKASALTPDEWAEIRRHPEYGKEALAEVTSIPTESKEVVYQHHENFDGTGYPQKLKGDEISKLARVVTIADVFDALTTDRSYHKAIPPVQALNTMFSMQPGKFDPQIFSAFNKNFDKKTDLALATNFDPCSPEAPKITKK